MPIRAGHVIKRVRWLHGPTTVPANSSIHNAIKFDAAAPCTNCYITDIVPEPRLRGDANTPTARSRTSTTTR